jgi:hypothetical protein
MPGSGKPALGDEPRSHPEQKPEAAVLGRNCRASEAPKASLWQGSTTMRRLAALPAMLVDVSLIAALAAGGMLLVFGLLYVTTALGRVDPYLL